MRPPALLLAGFGAFLVLLGYLLGSSLAKRSVPTFAPRSSAPERPGERHPDTLTVDAGDQARWRFVDLDRGVVLPPGDTAGWDLAVRRYRIIVSRSIADVGRVAFDGLAHTPSSGYITNTVGRDTTNAAILRWYSYGMLSHLLVPKDRRYVVRTSDGRFAKLELISYYCPGPRAGCMTVRYALLE